MENEINGKATKPFEPLQEDFPWLHIASFAIHQLINKWKLQPASKDINVQDKSLFSIQLPPKVCKCKLSFIYYLLFILNYH